MVAKKQQQGDAQVTAGTSVRTCTVVDSCTGTAVLQGVRSCDTCGDESTNLRENAQQRRDQIAGLEQREEQIKAQVRARDGACGCGDPSSHDGSPPEKPKRAKTAEDHVYQPGPCPTPQSSDLTGLEVLDLRLSSQHRQELGGQVEELDAAAGRVAKEHTHPVFACEKHTSRLSK